MFRQKTLKLTNEIVRPHKLEDHNSEVCVISNAFLNNVDVMGETGRVW